MTETQRLTMNEFLKAQVNHDLTIWRMVHADPKVDPNLTVLARQRLNELAAVLSICDLYDATVKVNHNSRGDLEQYFDGIEDCVIQLAYAYRDSSHYQPAWRK